MTSPLAGIAAINAIGFGVYGNAISQFRDKKAISSHFYAGAHRCLTKLVRPISGALSGLCQTVIASPMELMKLRVQVQQPDGLFARFHTPLECFRQTYAYQGVPGLYRLAHIHMQSSILI
jgi:solute carrier family 25 carnitine/acylcarnitine transporter 20/29